MSSINYQFNLESEFVRFEEICPPVHRLARFRINGGYSTIDKDGNKRDFYHVKIEDLEKRARKLRRQNVRPTETEEALREARRKGLLKPR